MARSITLVLLIISLGFSGISRAIDLDLTPSDRILILAPHPDDEVLCCSGIIETAVQNQLPLKIVVFTYGDNNAWAFTRYHHFPIFRPKKMLQMGEVRRIETLSATNVLGVLSDQVIFLGYPDFGTLSIWNDHWGSASSYESRMTVVQHVPYSTAFRMGADYKGEEIVQDIGNIIQDFEPTKVFVPDPADEQPDHRALFLFTRVSLLNQTIRVPPKIYSYLLHSKAWPKPKGLHKNQPLEPPTSNSDSHDWLSFPLSAAQVDRKYEALKKHQTQWAYSRKFLSSFVRTNELFKDSFRHSDLSQDLSDYHEQIVPAKAKDVEDFNVSIDNSDVVFDGRLSSKSNMTDIGVTVYGYRRDKPFEKMPKIFLKVKHGRLSVYDQQKPILDSGAHVQRDHRQFVIRIPLTILGNPERIFTSKGNLGSNESRWDSWQVTSIMKKE